MPLSPRRIALYVLAAVFAAAGLVLAFGGVQLIAAGGSWFYALAGLGFIATAALLFLRRPEALWLYAALTLVALIWALFEVGLFWWGLAPRGDVIVVLGLLLLIPWILHGLDAGESRVEHPFSSHALPLTGAIALTILVALASWFTNPFDQQGEVATAQASEPAADPLNGQWLSYGRTQWSQRYAPLDQINTETVSELEEVWRYNTGDTKMPDDPTETTFQVTPLMIEGVVYLCTQHQDVVALDAQSGEEVWRFDPGIRPEGSRQHQSCRGLAYRPAAEAPGSASADAACADRLYLPTADARLLAIDKDTGETCPAFGENGEIDLWRGMPNRKEGFYYSTSPPVVANGVIVIGGAVNDNVSVNEPSGVVRGYDAESGELLWAFDPGDPDLEVPLGPDQTYTENSPNVWAPMSADSELGLVYLPFGNMPPDQWGGNRPEDVERFSSSIVALDTRTGALEWVFQTVHHDVWDYDVPSQPTLMNLRTEVGETPVVIQATKQGEVYVLDRRTGEPVLPVEEIDVPQGAPPGDYSAPTQPVSAMSFNPPELTGADMWGATLFDQMACRLRFQQLNYEGRYTPQSVNGTLVYPGNFGVFNWGSIAVDPVTQTLYGTPGYLAFIHRLIPRENDTMNYVSEGDPGLNENYGAPFAVSLKPFTSRYTGLPCQRPPWGYAAAADLTTGETVWMRPRGTARDRAPVPLPLPVGVPDLGGPLVTAGDLMFETGRLDYFARAYDSRTGDKLWEARLPAGGQATPMTYLGEDGRQYLIVIAGGHGSLGTRIGDNVIAYALPEE